MGRNPKLKVGYYRLVVNTMKSLCQPTSRTIYLPDWWRNHAGAKVILQSLTVCVCVCVGVCVCLIERERERESVVACVYFRCMRSEQNLQDRVCACVSVLQLACNWSQAVS